MKKRFNVEYREKARDEADYVRSKDLSGKYKLPDIHQPVAPNNTSIPKWLIPLVVVSAVASVLFIIFILEQL